MTQDDPVAARMTVALDAIKEAGALAAGHFAGRAALVIEQKLNAQDVVSIADQSVEALLRQRIAAAFPDDGVLGEEEGLTEGSSGFVWVIDPIDGTSPFVHGLIDWCISVALTRGSETELGFVLQPTTGEFFTARRGHGALLNGTPISVDANATIANGLIGLGASFRIPLQSVSTFALKLMQAGGMFIRSGSGALMLAHVACGRLAGYYERHINAWDCMAALCLIREAGGYVAPYPGPGGLIEGGPIFAAAPGVKDELLAIVAAAEAMP